MSHFIKISVLLLLLAGMSSCASKKPITSSSGSISVSQLISEVADAELTGSFYERKMSVAAGGLSVNGSMKIVPKERVWMNISLLGITFGRAMFTQDSLMYYERAEKTAFAGSWEDFYSISSKFRAIDYSSVEDLLTARPIFELKSSLTIPDTNAETTAFSKQDKNKNLTKHILVSNSDSRIASQSIQTADAGISLSAEYFYKDDDSLPISIIFTFAGEDQRAIRFEFSQIKGQGNEDFPFRIPAGYSDAKTLAAKLLRTDI